MTMPQIKAEMEKTLHWLIPVATDTTKYAFINRNLTDRLVLCLTCIGLYQLSRLMSITQKSQMFCPTNK